MFLLHFIETILENREPKNAQITLNTQINPLEHTYFEQTINHIMIYVKTPLREKETRRTQKIQTKTKPKTAERKKKDYRILASGFARWRRESGGTSYQPGETERGRYESSRTRVEQERHLYPFL